MKFEFWCECDYPYEVEPENWSGCPKCGRISNSGNYAYCSKCGKGECFNENGESFQFKINLDKLINHKCKE